MATGNGNQQQNNNQPIQGRKIAGTNVAYTGMVVKLGEFELLVVELKVIDNNLNH